MRLTTIILLIFSFFSATAQKTNDPCTKAKILISFLKKHHFKAPELNQQLSESAFDIFMEHLDDRGIFFSEEDINRLKTYRSGIFSDVQSKECALHTMVSPLYKKKLLMTQEWIHEILEKPLDFSDNEKVTFYKSDEISYSENDTELKKYWKKRLKYYFLLEKNSYRDSEKPPSESTLREQVKEKELCRISRVLNHPMGYDEYITYLYLNSIAHIYDPHTSFYNSYSRNIFENHLSKDQLSFGIDLSENEGGEIIVAGLSPGGPAWKSNELNQDDIILSITYPGGNEIELTCKGIGEVNQILVSSSSKKVSLKVKKKSGQVKSITLYKEKLANEENVIDSFILKGEKKVGYISLPSFYTQWEDDNQLGCANDVAKEIVKLKKENVEGLILDLRNNGGGAMNEAIQLAGIFINYGPICTMVRQQEKPILLKDMNRGMIYSGPLVVMVNSLSASASELLAAALQDYNAAVIVGSPTYGKSTGQYVVPMDTNMVELNDQEKKGFDYVKVTNFKFYRVTGKSHQKSGVIPDIILPDILDELAYREQDNSTALENDAIDKKLYYTPFAEKSLEKIEMKSTERVDTHLQFQIIRQLQDSLAQTDGMNASLYLNPETFDDDLNKLFGTYELMDSLVTLPTTSYTVKNHAYNLEVLEMDERQKEINNQMIQNVKEDIYIEESYFIIKDLIENK